MPHRPPPRPQEVPRRTDSDRDGPRGWVDAIEAGSLIGAPWPFTPEEMASAMAALPEGGEQFSDQIVWYVRRYMAAHLRPGPRRKPNIHAELSKAKRQAEALHSTLKQLGVESRLFLAENRGHRDNRVGLYELTTALDRFCRNRGLQVIPPPALGGQGRPADDWNKLLYSHLERIWKACHGGAVPKRGWPRFRDACLRPLERMSVLRDLGDRSKQHIGTKAKRVRK